MFLSLLIPKRCGGKPTGRRKPVEEGDGIIFVKELL